MARTSSPTNNEAVVFWVIWFPAFVHKNRFDAIEYIEKHATAYHLKKVCHLHLFHGDDSAKADYNDYYFKIFSSKEKPDINEANGDAIKYYLESFCDRYNRHIAFFEQFMCPLKDRDPKRNLSALIEERTNNANVTLGLGIIDKANVEKDGNTKTAEIFDGQEYISHAATKFNH
jgi:hypothetical protein